MERRELLKTIVAAPLVLLDTPDGEQKAEILTEHAQRVTMGPDDVFVLTYEHHLKPEQVAMIRKSWEQLHGGLSKHTPILLSGGLKLGIIHREK